MAVLVLMIGLLLWGLAHVIPVGGTPSLPVGVRHSGSREAHFRSLRPRLWRGRRAAVDAGEFLTEVATRLRSGMPAETAWDDAAARSGLPTGIDEDGVPRVLSVLSTGAVGSGAEAAWRLANELGAPLAEILDECSLAMTHAEENDAARSIALAGPVASARMLAALPVAGVMLGSALGADPLRQLLGGGLGTLAGLLGITLYLVGVRWSGRLVRAARGAES